MPDTRRSLRRRRRPSPVALAVALAAAIFGSACGGSDSGGGTIAPVAPVVPVVTTINVTLPLATIEVGSTTTATAAVLDQNSAPVSGASLVWTSDNPAVATVGATGVVTAVSAGTANIVATVGSKQGKAGAVVTTWVFDGPLLSNADFGGAAGGLADVSVFRIQDGRYRMIIGGFPNSPGGFGSAISSDGLKFTMESGVRLSTPVVVNGINSSFIKPVGVRMDDGRIRLFATASGGVPDGIYSFTSSDDGVTFTPDAGARITLAASGLEEVGTGSIVKVKSGGWRMYLNDNPPPTVVGNATILAHTKTVSAFSQDLTTWTMDPGVRIGVGATLSGDAQSAGSVLNADGSTTIVYFRQSTGSSFQSTSADGLTFTTEVPTGFAATGGRFPVPLVDSDVFPLPNGDVRVYFNWGNNVAGTIYAAHHVAFGAK